MRAFYARVILALCLALFGAIPSQAFYGDTFHLDPTLNWKTLETPHFRVVYPESLDYAAGRVGMYLEEAHTLYVPRFRWEPRTKTSVLLVDNEDSANGLSAAALRIGILLRLVPPDSWSSIRWYDNWLRMLVLHEYTHHMNIDPTVGFWEALRVVFGDGVRPNGLWPRWMTEGLAVYMESEMTEGGRGRSTYWDMILRTSVDEDVLDTPDFVTIDRMAGDMPYFPSGEAAYLFGYEMMKKAAATSPIKGQVLGDLSIHSAGEVPFFINSDLRTVLGREWTELWTEWVDETRARAKADLKAIASLPVTEAELLDTGLGTENMRGLGLKMSPNGKWLAFKGHTADVWAGIYLRDLETGTQTRLMDTNEGSAFGFTPDSEALVVSSLRRMESDVEYSDLAVIPLMEKGEFAPQAPVWLTRQARAKDPAVSREPIGGKVRVAFTKTRESTVGLAWAELNLVNGNYELGPIDELFWPESGEVVSHPTFAPNGKTLVFSLHRKNTLAEDLVELDLQNRRTRTLVRNGAVNTQPTFRSDGVLHFVSDATGVPNLWRLAGGAPELVTNFKSGIAFPTFDTRAGHSQDAWTQVFTSKGWRFGRVANPVRALNAKAVQIQRPKPLPAQLAAGQNTKTSVEDRPDLVLPESFSKSNYSAWPTFAPRSWGPIIAGASTVSTSLWQLGGNVIGFDALDTHRYVLLGAYNTGFSEFEGYVQYGFRGLGPLFTFTFQDLYSSMVLSSSTITGTKQMAADLTVSKPIEWTFSSLTPSLSVTYQRDTDVAVSSSTKTATLASMFPSLTGSVVYSNARSSSLAVISESGFRTSLAGQASFLQNEAAAIKSIVTVRPYFQILPHVVLTPTLAGGYLNTAASLRAARLRVESPATSLFSSPGSLSLSKFRVRGYPTYIFYPQWIAHGNAELHFPIWNIYRGWSTNPFSLERLTGFAYGEYTRLYYFTGTYQDLPAAGGGVKLTGEILRVPLALSGEIDYGFDTSANAGGAFQWAVRLALGELPF